VYKAQCLETQETVIIKIYERAKMKAKHEQRLQREIRLMRQLQGSEGKLLLNCWEVYTNFTTAKPDEWIYGECLGRAALQPTSAMLLQVHVASLYVTYRCMCSVLTSADGCHV
jgi:hypothetical protein